MIWEFVKQSVKEILHFKFSRFPNRENNISKNEPPDQFTAKCTNSLIRGPPKNNLIWEDFARETFASPNIREIFANIE